MSQELKFEKNHLISLVESSVTQDEIKTKQKGVYFIRNMSSLSYAQNETNLTAAFQ